MGVAGGTWSVDPLELELEPSESSSSGTTGNWNESVKFCDPEPLLFELDLVDSGGDFFFTGGTVSN